MLHHCLLPINLCRAHCWLTPTKLMFVTVIVLWVPNVVFTEPVRTSSRFDPAAIYTLNIPLNGNEHIINMTIGGNVIPLAIAPTHGSPLITSPFQQMTPMCPRCGCGMIFRNTRIVGGVETEQHEFPWMASLSRNGRFYCAASIITRMHLLTAAHCVEGIYARTIHVTVGEHVRSGFNSYSKLVVRVAKIIRHPKFDISNFNNDVAVLKLDAPLSFRSPHIQPACLPSSDNRNYTNIMATVSGWGRTGEKATTSDSLMKVNVPIMSEEDCKSAGYAKEKITSGMICAGYKTGSKDSCQGDSGGPLQIPGSRFGTMEVVGIVSWGRGCARANYPGVYTRVEKFMPWITSHLDGECACKN